MAKRRSLWEDMHKGRGPRTKPGGVLNTQKVRKRRLTRPGVEETGECPIAGAEGRAQEELPTGSHFLEDT